LFEDIIIIQINYYHIFIEQKNMRLLKKPVLCNYYLTYRCNAKCSFCDIWERPSPFVKIENVRQNLKALKKLGVKVIDFTGGEPLLHPQVADFLTIAKELKFITTLTTNGVRYPQLASKLKGKIDMLHFSLDSSDKEEHDKSRGIACFDVVMESIQVAKSLGERPDILFTVWEENLHHVEKIWKSICLPNNLVLILNPIFDYETKNTQLNLSEKAFSKLRFWANQKNIYLNEAFLTLREDGGNHIDDPICKAASSTLVISPKNELILPCYHLGVHEIDINSNLFDLYKSSKVQNLIRQEGRLPECEGCVINCYMQPSFAVNLNKYWLEAFKSTAKYNLMKGTWRKLLFN
jgi:MoaA/NifB/PqqE/SkfB family radical SAM enzyme